MGDAEYPPLAEVRDHLRVKWYRSPVEPATLRRLMQRSDLQGWLQAGGHLALAVATATLVWWCWSRHLWLGFALMLFAHGTVVSFFTGVAPHELAHGTVFRTKRLNGVFLYLLSLLSWWDPFDYGTSHTYHHRYTLYPEGDRENLLPLHPSVGRTFLLQMFTVNLLTRPGRNFSKGGLLSTVAITVLSSLGLMGSTKAPIRQWIEALHLDQPAEAWKSIWWARAQLLFHGTVVVVGLASGLWVLPLVITASAVHRQLARLLRRPPPALRPAGQRPRLPQVDPFDEAGPDLHLPLLAHELAHRTPHVRRRAVLQPEEAGARDRRRHAGAAHAGGRLARDARDLEPAGRRSRLPVRHAAAADGGQHRPRRAGQRRAGQPGGLDRRAGSLRIALAGNRDDFDCERMARS